MDRSTRPGDLLKLGAVDGGTREQSSGIVRSGADTDSLAIFGLVAPRASGLETSTRRPAATPPAIR